MALKLFAHVLRSEIPAGGEPGATAALNPSRWLFRDIVVRRDGYAPWGLSLWSSANASALAPEPAVEPLWPETQPWCHE